MFSWREGNSEKRKRERVFYLRVRGRKGEVSRSKQRWSTGLWRQRSSERWW